MNQTTFFHSYVPMVYQPDVEAEAKIKLRMLIDRHVSTSYMSGLGIGFIMGFVVGVVCIALNVEAFRK
jgi:hypothetical protein